MPESVFPVICAADVAVSRDFYVSLLGFRVVFDSDWYVQLHSPSDPRVQLGIVDRQHETVPASARGAAPTGIIIGVEVPDVDAVCARAVELRCPMHLAVRDERFGQRHFITADPDGTFVDVITPIDLAEEYRDALPEAGDA